MANYLRHSFMNRQTSKYAQRMHRLSCKIFNEFYFPELTPAQLDYTPYDSRNRTFFFNTIANMRVVQRNMEKPFDLDDTKNYNYYPAHPQIRELTHTLREYGLFRDEHRDFNEAMKGVALARGKVFREVRGPGIKKKEGNKGKK